MTTEIEEVKELLSQRAKLWEQEQLVTEKIKELKQRYEKSQSGIEIGCIVKDKKGNIYKVAEMEFWDMDMEVHTIKAYPKKKDGSFSTATRNLWKNQDGIVVISS